MGIDNNSKPYTLNPNPKPHNLIPKPSVKTFRDTPLPVGDCYRPGGLLKFLKPFP